MYKLLIVIAIGWALLFPAAVPAKVHVVATLTEIGALAEEIGGDRVEVTTLARGNEDPHYLPAKPSHSRRMMKADLLVYNGLQLEVGWLPLLIDGARNPQIRPGAPGSLELGDRIEPLEVPTGSVDRSMGDVHPEGNPHFTIDPAVYSLLAKVLAERLARIDGEGAEYYAERRADFDIRWETALAGWKERLAFLEGASVVTYHQQWEYLARTLGFVIAGKIEDRPGIPPTPRHLADLERTIAEKNVRWILYSDLIYPEVPEKLARRSGSRSFALPQGVGSRPGTDDLFSWFEALVQAFEAGREE